MIWADGASGKFTVAGATLEFATWGPAPDAAPTLVLLHEGLGCVALWRDFPAKLAEATGFGVFAYSRAGYGQSDPCVLPRPLDYMSREALDVLPDVLAAIGFQQGVLLGHSDGATIAAIYAGSVIDHRVRGLILIAPHFFTESMGLAAIAKAKTAFQMGDLKERLGKYHSDAEATFLGWNDVWLDPGFRSWDVSDVIDYLRIPTLAIQGLQDEYGTLAQVKEIAARSYAPVDMCTPDACRHAPHLDQPDLVLSEIAEFTTRLMRMEKVQVKVA